MATLEGDQAEAAALSMAAQDQVHHGSGPRSARPVDEVLALEVGDRGRAQYVVLLATTTAFIATGGCLWPGALWPLRVHDWEA